VPVVRSALFADSTAQNFRGTFGEAGRLVAYPGKTEVACPAPGPDTAIVLAIGQSNAANQAENRFTSHYRGDVVNFFEGKCYRAESPLLGATAEEGEFLTPLGDKLVDDGAYKRVVIVTSAVGASEIARWRKGGALNNLMLHALTGLLPGYRVTQVIWVQGEADYAIGTQPADYTDAFHSLLDTLSEGGVTAPLFLAIATRCVSSWKPDNPIAADQRALVDNRRVFLGADTDALVGDTDRRPDGCHFGAHGQLKAANAFATAIEKVKAGGLPAAVPLPAGAPTDR
jgi:carbohydrate esterase-like sialic acid-specific acetylesterase